MISKRKTLHTKRPSTASWNAMHQRQNYKERIKNIRNVYTTNIQLLELPRILLKLECIYNSDALFKINKAEWGVKKRTISVSMGEMDREFE